MDSHDGPDGRGRERLQDLESAILTLQARAVEMDLDLCSTMLRMAALNVGMLLGNRK